MKFTVYRSKWARGHRTDRHGDKENLLRGLDRQQCCLGFVARELGCTVKAIESRGVPSSAALTPEAQDFFLAPEVGVLWDEKPWIREAAGINDNWYLSDKEREKQLRELFKANGHQIVFKP